MKKFLGYMFCACLLMSTSAAFSDNHLDGTVKFQNGEKYAGCVYGESGPVMEWVYEYDRYGRGTKVWKAVPCGIAWEGKGLFQKPIERRGGLYLHKEVDLYDLQRAYSCCTSDQTRLAICKTYGSPPDLNTCSDYLDAMWGDLPGGGFQDEANLAAQFGCIKAISGNVPDYRNWLLSSEYHGRMDKLFEACVESEGLIESAISHMFDFLRDGEGGCLWNKPDEDFCAGSRREEGGWKVVK